MKLQWFLLTFCFINFVICSGLNHTITDIIYNNTDDKLTIFWNYNGPPPDDQMNFFSLSTSLPDINKTVHYTPNGIYNATIPRPLNWKSKSFEVILRIKQIDKNYKFPVTRNVDLPININASVDDCNKSQFELNIGNQNHMLARGNLSYCFSALKFPFSISYNCQNQKNELNGSTLLMNNSLNCFFDNLPEKTNINNATIPLNFTICEKNKTNSPNISLIAILKDPFNNYFYINIQNLTVPSDCLKYFQPDNEKTWLVVLITSGIIIFAIVAIILIILCYRSYKKNQIEKEAEVELESIKEPKDGEISSRKKLHQILVFYNKTESLLQNEFEKIPMNFKSTENGVTWTAKPNGKRKYILMTKGVINESVILDEKPFAIIFLNYKSNEAQNYLLINRNYGYNKRQLKLQNDQNGLAPAIKLYENYTTLEEMKRNPLLMVNMLKEFRRFMKEHNESTIVVVSNNEDLSGLFLLVNRLLDLKEVDLNEHLHYLRKSFGINFIQSFTAYKIAACVLDAYNYKNETIIRIEDYEVDSFNAQELLKWIEWNMYHFNLFYEKSRFEDYNREHMLKSSDTLVLNTIHSYSGFLNLNGFPDGNDDENDIFNAVKITDVLPDVPIVNNSQPFQLLLDEFWRLLEFSETEMVLSMQASQLNFYPHQEKMAMQPFKYLTVTCLSKIETEYTREFFIRIDNKRLKRTRKLRWIEMRVRHPDEKHLLKFISRFKEVHQNKEKLQLICCDGTKYCGLFLALIQIIDLAEIYGEINIVDPVLHLRYYRKEFIRNTEQMEFLLRAIKLFFEKKEQIVHNSDSEYTSLVQGKLF